MVGLSIHFLEGAEEEMSSLTFLMLVCVSLCTIDTRRHLVIRREMGKKEWKKGQGWSS